MKTGRSYDVIVVGAGIAGLTSAAYLSRYGYRTLLCEKESKTGGLIQSFRQWGFSFDAGIRAFENSGILIPMMKELGIDIELIRNPITIGVEERMTRLEDYDSLQNYGIMLKDLFPANVADVDKIIREIKKATKYMDVLYGIDNPLFMGDAIEMGYLMGTLLPWLIKYKWSMRRMKKLQEPIHDYLHRLTDNQALVDIITQHFFQKTPAFFALSYFRLYLDYHYPMGGTGVLIDKLNRLIIDKEGIIATNTEIVGIDPERMQVKTSDGRIYRCRKLIWCADMKSLYASLDRTLVRNPQLAEKINTMGNQVRKNQGGDSVFSAYLAVYLDKSYFQNICGPHAFYTPDKSGLSSLGLDSWKIIQSGQISEEGKRAALKDWLNTYLYLTTYEISCPSLRDATLAPEGMTGVIVSTLMDYELVKHISAMGWYEEFKEYCMEEIIIILERILFPGWDKKILDKRCSTPLTLERMTGNSEGAITGWAFTNEDMPAENRFSKIKQAIRTPVPNIYQAGQWTFSPSGLPVSILTGKLAAEAVRKGL